MLGAIPGAFPLVDEAEKEESKKTQEPSRADRS